MTQDQIEARKRRLHANLVELNQKVAATQERLTRAVSGEEVIYLTHVLRVRQTEAEFHRLCLTQMRCPNSLRAEFGFDPPALGS